jgi:outer membrane protein OmpA-like peptidoglycan-associated protein
MFLYFLMNLGLNLFTTSVFAEVKYLNSEPLSQSVNVPVESCGSPSTTSVPVITWGGDIATIYANGGAADTSAGSVFDKQKLKIKLFREDVFANQLKSYVTCKSPYLRGTVAMIHMASEVANRDPRTKMNVIYQLTWSAGGDAMVVKGGIQKPSQLKGKTIAIQAYGPHIDYLGKILKDGGLSLKDVKIRWTKDLTGTGQSPSAAFYNGDIDAAMVIIPDALKLTSNGSVGTGAEDSVKGAKILLSTKTASRVISDVYAVRSDYLEANRLSVMKFVQGLLVAQEELATLMKDKSKRKSEYDKVIKGSAKILLDSEQAVADTEGMYADANFVGWNGNVSFFTDSKNPRNFEEIGKEAQDSLKAVGLIAKTTNVQKADWKFEDLKKDLKNLGGSGSAQFNADKVAQVAAKRSAQDKTEGELFSFEVFFKPNQNSFSSSEYPDAFKKAVNLAATYGGAVVTIEGHSDPLGYLKKKKDGENQIVLSRMRQSLKNLSLTRATAVRDSLLNYSKNRGVSVDPGQFAVIGHGIDKPNSGLCGSDPCPPKSEKEWLSNMRVQFRLIQIEAEQNVFESL